MSQSFTKGNLRYWEASKCGYGTTFNVTLLRCPVCGVEFSGGQHREAHLRNDHDPEDFGL